MTDRRNIPTIEQLIEWHKRFPKRIECYNTKGWEKTLFKWESALVGERSGDKCQIGKKILKGVRTLGHPEILSFVGNQNDRVFYTHPETDQYSGGVCPQFKDRPYSFKHEDHIYYLSEGEFEFLLGKDYLRHILKFFNFRTEFHI